SRAVESCFKGLRPRGGERRDRLEMEGAHVEPAPTERPREPATGRPCYEISMPAGRGGKPPPRHLGIERRPAGTAERPRALMRRLRDDAISLTDLTDVARRSELASP